MFPQQPSLSTTEKVSTAVPEFIPHHEIIHWSPLDLFQSTSISISSSDESYLNKLKSASNNDKTTASEIA